MKHISESEKLKENPAGNKPIRGKNGGARPGAGRPKGSLSAQKIKIQESYRMMREMIMKELYTLLQSQFILARGVNIVYKIVRTPQGKGKPDKVEHMMVDDAAEIKEFLDEYEGANGSIEGDFYYITTKIPDNRALDSLLDRLFGKARQNIGLDGGEDDTPVTVRTILDVIENNET